MQSASQKNNYTIRVILLISIILQIILFIQTDSYLLLLFSFFFLLILFGLALNLWLHFLNPETGFFDNFLLSLHCIRNILQPKEILRVVKGGKFQQDYFLLKKKPPIGFLLLDNNSAAVTSLPDDDLQVLMPGFHHIKRDEHILLTFDLKRQDFIYGPQSGENPFELKRSGDNYTDFHARQLNARNVKSFSKEECEMYPSFHISYQLALNPERDPQACKTLLSEVAKDLVRNNKNGEATPLINGLIGKQIITLWSTLVEEYAIQELFAKNGQGNINRIMEIINMSFSDPDKFVHIMTDSPLKSQKRADKVEKFQWELLNIRIHLNDLWIQTENPTSREMDQ